MDQKRVAPVRDLGLRDATDREIFLEAKKKSAIIMTKDSDFLRLVDKYGTPPQVIWITIGNTSNERLKRVFKKTLDEAIKLIKMGEPIVEISDIL